MENSRFIKGIFYFLIFICVVLAGTMLKVLEDFFKPVVLAVLLAAVFYPFVKRLNTKFKFPWFLGILIVYAFFSIVFILLGNILSSSLLSIINSYPKYEEKFRMIYRAMQQSFAENKDSGILNFFFDVNQDQTLLQNLSAQLNIFGLLKNFAVNFGGFLVSFMKSTFLVVLFSIFLLLEMKFTKKKIYAAFSSENSTKIHDIMELIAKDTTHYISIKFFISLLTGIFVFIFCLIAGLDFPLVWAFLAFILNFVPTFGSIISWAITTVFAFLQCYPHPFPVIFIAVSVLLMNVILGNVIEPRIEGENLGISPFMILLSLSLWGWLWGFLGLIVAVPLMVIIKIFCENISVLHPIGILLDGKTR